MTELAIEIYKALRRTIQRKHSTITYKELAEVVSKKHPTHQRSPAFHAALTELTTKCRDAGVPCIAAIVCSASTNRPGDGYYKAAHPRAKTDESRKAAWQREHTAVVSNAEKFPSAL
jgi:hypothetical protein